MDMLVSPRYCIEQNQQQADAIIQAIACARLHAGNIHADAIRELGKYDYGIRGRLQYGQKTLCGQQELAQYLYSYAPMVEAQWQQFVHCCTVEPQGPFHVADYGCGQGMGLANVLDHMSHQGRRQVNGIHLVEPSADALARARAVATAYLPGRPCSAYQARVEQLHARHLPFNPHGHYLHLFSNVLDIVQFNPRTLLENLLHCPGQHTFWAVSHDRDFDGGSKAVHATARWLDSLAGAQASVTLRHNLLESFDVTMRSRTSRAIAWQAQVEVG